MTRESARLTLLPFEVLWRCDGCGMEQITPRDDPPANCPRCRHPSVFFVRKGDDDDAPSDAGAAA